MDGGELFPLVSLIALQIMNVKCVWGFAFSPNWCILLNVTFFLGKMVREDLWNKIAWTNCK